MELKKVVVTGATGGLGASVTRALLEQGFSVVGMGRSASKLDALRQGLGSTLAQGFEAATVDATDPESVEAAFLALEGRSVTGLVHTVGGYTGGVSIVETSVADFDKMVSLNMRSTFLALRAGARLLVKEGAPGSVVCIGSVAGRSGVEGHAPYAASKAAVHSLVQSAAADLAGENIRVNALLPGTIATAANISAMPGADHSSWVTPEELSETISFLLSSAASGVTGACIEVMAKGYTPG